MKPAKLFVAILALAAIAAAIYLLGNNQPSASNGAEAGQAEATSTEASATPATETDAETTTSATASPQASMLHGIMESDLVVGDADAPVTIIEYSSMSCPHCAAFHATLYPELKRKYIDTGIVKFANRHFPLNEPALRAGMVTLCAGKEKGVTYTDVFFKTQEKWAFGPDFLDNIKKIAAVGGMDSAAFDACMNNKELETSILQSRKEAQETLNLQSTPTFFINGTEVKGDLSIEMFDKVIKEAQDKAE